MYACAYNPMGVTYSAEATSRTVKNKHKSIDLYNFILVN